MEKFSSVHNLQALSALLSFPADQESDDEDYKNGTPMAKFGPGHIGASFSSSGKGNKAVNSAYVKKQTNDIWDAEEVTGGTQFDDLEDPRSQPEYEVILKQSVGTEDLFLGISRKDPSSMCCENMMVRVKLPETKTSDIVLDIKENFIDLRTPKYKLGLHLPHPVYHREGTAIFIMDRSELEITLPMNRPLDCIKLA
ncbi:protein PIH1D3 [Trichomycterus rosablanca]|uniref:protein PIH1D3 n=1 Tax=Trichomycterus rosablanca TaxID=2290929 RepID=UPI002F357682